MEGPNFKLFEDFTSAEVSNAITRYKNLHDLLSKISIYENLEVEEVISKFVAKREIIDAFNVISDPVSNVGLLEIYSDPSEYIKSKFEEIHRILLPTSIVSILNSNANLQHHFNNLVYSIMIGSSTVENYYYLPDYTEKTLDEGITEFVEVLTSHLNS